MLLVDPADQKPSRFISRTSGNFHQSGIRAKLLSLLKINAVLPLVLSALMGIVLELHTSKSDNAVY